ncbi:MAG: hypothetical protein ACRD9L_21850 [Bryobacteraceae bacterium]
MPADELLRSAESAEFERAAYRNVTWRLIPFLFLCYILPTSTG